MLENEQKIITSNIGKWLQFVVDDVPPWVHSTTFEVFLWILSAFFILFSVSSILYKKYYNFKNNIDLQGLFSINNPRASLIDIADRVNKTYNIPINRIHSLLLQGFWNGYFDKFLELNRLNILKNILYDQSVRNNFVWHYLDDTPPVTSWDLPEGSTKYDIRPILTVPSKNTTNWTIENCKEAFTELADQPIYQMWPEYITPLIRPSFKLIKISQKSLNTFLTKEKNISKKNGWDGGS